MSVFVTHVPGFACFMPLVRGLLRLRDRSLAELAALANLLCSCSGQAGLESSEAEGPAGAYLSSRSKDTGVVCSASKDRV